MLLGCMSHHTHVSCYDLFQVWGKYYSALQKTEDPPFISIRPHCFRSAQSIFHQFHLSHWTRQWNCSPLGSPNVWRPERDSPPLVDERWVWQPPRKGLKPWTNWRQETNSDGKQLEETPWFLRFPSPFGVYLRTTRKMSH